MKRNYRAPEIHCHSCAGLIRETLDGVPGVSDVQVDVAQKTITVEYAEPEPSQANPEQKVLQLLEEEGYTAQAV